MNITSKFHVELFRLRTYYNKHFTRQLRVLKAAVGVERLFVHNSIKHPAPQNVV